MISLEQLSARLVGQFKSVRLTALQDSPSAFGSTFARESQLSDEDWHKRAAIWNGDRSVCYIAMDEGMPCGIIAGKFDDDHPRRAEVLSMWVAPEQRRTGLGTWLVKSVQSWARELGADELRLMVTSRNSAAMRFYERCGFVFTGVTGPYPNDAALFEHEMVKLLGNS